MIPTRPRLVRRRAHYVQVLGLLSHGTDHAHHTEDDATDTSGLPRGEPAAPPQRAGVTTRRAASAASAAVLAVEVIGCILMWAPIPLAWMWVGARVFAVTGSLAAQGSVAFLGFVATTWLAMAALARIDSGWVALRRRAGHDQPDGALAQVVVVSFTLGIVAFLLWYYVIEQAFVIPFMPTQ